MSTPFNAQHGLVIVRVRLFGPAGDRSARFALDTGATSTTVNTDILAAIGYDPSALPNTVRMTTGSGTAHAPRLTVDRIESLGQSRTGFPVVAHTLPPAAALDGLLGLDLFRGLTLTLDFRNGEITLI